MHSEGFHEEDVISRQDHEQETEKLELEIERCKEMIKAQQQLLQVNRPGRSPSPPSLNGCGVASGRRSLHVTTASGRCLLLHLQKSVELTFPISAESALVVRPYLFLMWSLLYHGKQQVGKLVLTGLLIPHKECPWPN